MKTPVASDGESISTVVFGCKGRGVRSLLVRARLVSSHFYFVRKCRSLLDPGEARLRAVVLSFFSREPAALLCLGAISLLLRCSALGCCCSGIRQWASRCSAACRVVYMPLFLRHGPGLMMMMVMVMCARRGFVDPPIILPPVGDLWLFR